MKDEGIDDLTIFMKGEGGGGNSETANAKNTGGKTGSTKGGRRRITLAVVVGASVVATAGALLVGKRDTALIEDPVVDQIIARAMQSTELQGAIGSKENSPPAEGLPSVPEGDLPVMQQDKPVEGDLPVMQQDKPVEGDLPVMQQDKPVDYQAPVSDAKAAIVSAPKESAKPVPVKTAQMATDGNAESTAQLKRLHLKVEALQDDLYRTQKKLEAAKRGSSDRKSYVVVAVLTDGVVVRDDAGVEHIVSIGSKLR
jgi:hypothetical protein